MRESSPSRWCTSTHRILELYDPQTAAARGTFEDFVSRQWENRLRQKDVSPSTRDGYRSLLRRYVLPVIGRVPLAAIQPAHIDAMLERADGLSPKTVMNLVKLMSGIFKLALDRKFITDLPVRDSHRPVVRKKAKPIWTPPELQAILAPLAPRYRTLFTVVAALGIRVGELLALQWKHVERISEISGV